MKRRGHELPAPHTRAGGHGCLGDGHRDAAGAEGSPWGCQGIRAAFAGDTPRRHRLQPFLCYPENSLITPALSIATVALES